MRPVEPLAHHFRMAGRSAETPAERLRVAFEQHELAVRMLEQRYRRTHVGAGGAEVEAAVDAWHARRPGAERSRH